MLAVVVIIVLAVSGGYYVINTNAANSAQSTTVTIIGSTPGLYGENATQNPDAFIPHEFNVTEGQHVTLVFENQDDGPHQLVIPAFNVDTGLVQGGQTVRVQFVPNKLGTFPFSQPAGACDYGGLTPQQGGCTGVQETNGNMTVLAP